MPLSRGLAETRHDGCLASFPPKTGDRAGLAPPRRSNLASVAVELIHDSRQEDGCGRLGNYSDCLKHDRENYTLARPRPTAIGSRRSSPAYFRVTIGLNAFVTLVHLCLTQFRLCSGTHYGYPTTGAYGLPAARAAI